MSERRQQLQLIWYKAYSDLLAEASRGALGLLWWILDPILYMGAFYIIFELAFKRGGEGFVPYLLIGLVSWKWFASSINNGSDSILKARGLISQVYVPKIIFPIAVVCVTTFKFLIVFALLLIFVVLNDYPPSVHWLALPLITLLQLALTLGGAMLVSALVPALPDLRLVIDNALLLMFFLSGIFFDLAEVTGTTGQILSLNPMAIVIDSLRAVLLDDQWPDWQRLAYLGTWATALISLSLAIHRRLDRVFPKFI